MRSLKIFFHFGIWYLVDDVTKLLQKHFGTEWKDILSLNFYKEVEERLLAANLESFDFVPEPEEENLCEHGFKEVTTNV